MPRNRHPKINVDPRIHIRVVPDGEIHITFDWTLEDLELFARYWLAMNDGEVKPGDVGAVFRLRNKDGVDYLIHELQKARNQLWKE